MAKQLVLLPNKFSLCRTEWETKIEKFRRDIHSLRIRYQCGTARR